MARDKNGFALPTVLIASMVMLMVLLASVASTTAIRISLSAQYYNSLAQAAGDSGVTYAKACLAANNGAAQWSDSSPLKPDTDCSGAPLAGCPSDPANACHYIANNGNVASTFSIGLPQSGNVVSVGSVRLLRTSDQSIWRQFTQTSRANTSALTSAMAYGDGGDGAVTIAANKNINTDILTAGRTCADGVNYALSAVTTNTATLATAPAAGCLVAGDEVLIINLQGTTTNTANVGNYETLRIASVAGSVVTFTKNKSKYYGNDISNDTNIGSGSTFQRVMLQRVPNYTDVTVNNGITLTANAWDGASGKGGILAFRSNHTVTNNGTITAAGLGHMYGVGGDNSCPSYPWPTTTGDHGASVNGDNSVSICNRRASVVGHLVPLATNLGGGGGGAGSNVSGGKRNGGGGGGGSYGNNGTAGSNSTSGEVGGATGSGYGSATLTQLFLGSGGGGGGRGVNANGANGGRGGGIILMSAVSFTNTGSVTAAGLAGSNGVSSDDGGGGGGGGSGGSIVIQGGTLTIGANLIVSSGGAGGTKGTGTTYGSGGNGGAGGVGRIGLFSQNAISGTSSPTFTLLPAWYF